VVRRSRRIVKTQFCLQQYPHNTNHSVWFLHGPKNMWNCNESFNGNITKEIGPAIAQEVSRWLPTEAAPGSSSGHFMWDLWYTKWRGAGGDIF
jgi:hypothetical protein